jgi:DNA-binding transcriptional regulator YhcF (GntR family)
MNVDQSLSAATAIQRVTNRLALEFMLKGARIGGWAHGGNLNRSLTYFAIQDANVEHLSRDPKLAWTYADDYPPDNVRRPISVHALAQTLNFSPETVRRHVLALIEEGACDRIEGQGVIIPKRHLMTPKIQGQRMAIIAAFNQLISDLNAIGFDFAAAPPRNSSISEAVRNRNTAPVLPDHAAYKRLHPSRFDGRDQSSWGFSDECDLRDDHGDKYAPHHLRSQADVAVRRGRSNAPRRFSHARQHPSARGGIGHALQHCPAAGAEDGGARPVSAPGKRIHHPERLHDQA